MTGIRRHTTQSPLDFAIATRKIDGCTVVAVRGELDLATATLLEQELAAREGGDPLVVDLSETTFIDSWGVQAVVEGGPAGPRSVVCPGHVLRRLLELAGTANVPIYDSLERALSESGQDGQTRPGWRSRLGLGP